MLKPKAIVRIIIVVWVFVLFGAANRIPGQAAAPFQQASQTATPTLTQTPADSATASLTPGTVTASPSATQTPQPATSEPAASASPTATSQQPLFPTFTSAVFETPTEIFLPEETQAVEEPQPAETATLIPFPTITFQYPQVTRTGSLAYAQHQPGSPDLPKERVSPVWGRLLRLWPVLLLALVWLVIAIWFVVAQRFVDD